MSEYQYYEFQALDRRLTEMEMEALRAISSRAEITATRFVNVYNFGDFKGDPDLLMEKYFDGFVYVANWGTHEFQLALPAKVISLQTARLYCSGDALSVRQKSGKLIFTFRSDEEGGDGWEEGEDLLSGLLPIRDELLQGDLRALYLGWLARVQLEELGENKKEPPVPPGLGKLSVALANLVDFLRLDPDLIAAAAQTSVRLQPNADFKKQMAAWIKSLPTREKEDLLVRFATEDPQVRPELRTRFNRLWSERHPLPDTPRRTVAELREVAEDLRK